MKITTEYHETSLKALLGYLAYGFKVQKGKKVIKSEAFLKPQDSNGDIAIIFRLTLGDKEGPH